MKLGIEKDRLLIIPEDDQDEAYIRDTLGLKNGAHLLPCTLRQESRDFGKETKIYLEVKAKTPAEKSP